MRAVAFIVGLLLILTILWDTFETVILPRRVTRRIKLTSLFYSSAWIPWSSIGRSIGNERQREKYLSLFGPLSLFFLLGLWAFVLILGYALLYWATNPGLLAPHDNVGFPTYLYLSGVTFFTLGYGDVVPILPAGRGLAVFETANGFGLFAVVISYLPVLYQSFSPDVFQPRGK